MRIINFLFIAFFSVSISGQTKLTRKQVEELPNTIENQFIKTYRKASTWQKYKMIPKTEFQIFQKSILDSVSLLKKDIIVRQSTIDSQGKKIISLNEKMKKLMDSLDNAISKKDTINFLGNTMSRKLYYLLTWSIITLLILSLLFFSFRFKSSNIFAKQAKKKLIEIEEEFELYRKKSIEKEQRLRRQIQDEINKQRGV